MKPWLALGAVLAITAAHAGTPLVAPTKVTLSFPGNRLAFIHAANGKPLYRLTLSADPTASGITSMFSLLLVPLNAKPDADNLLDPPGRWHGYQPYFFRSDDFAEGAAKSQFGPVREFCRDETGLITTIAIRNVAIAPTKDPNEPRFRNLVLDVTLKSAPLVKGRPVCP